MDKQPFKNSLVSAAVKCIGYQPNTLSSFIEPLETAFGLMINHKFGSIGGVTSDNCMMERLQTVIFGRVTRHGAQLVIKRALYCKNMLRNGFLTHENLLKCTKKLVVLNFEFLFHYLEQITCELEEKNQ